MQAYFTYFDYSHGTFKAWPSLYVVKLNKHRSTFASNNLKSRALQM